MLGRGVLLQLAAGDVVIGQQQPVRTHERPRPAVVQAHAGEAHVIEPCAVGVKLYLSLSCLTGGLSKVHMPSSAKSEPQTSAPQTAANNERESVEAFIVLAYPK